MYKFRGTCRDGPTGSPWSLDCTVLVSGKRKGTKDVGGDFRTKRQEIYVVLLTVAG